MLLKERDKVLHPHKETEKISEINNQACIKVLVVTEILGTA
jgi:hypothetical protein